MSVIDSLRALFWGRSRNVQVVYAVRAANVLGMGPTEMYRKQPALRAVISFIADNVADVPIKCYVRRGDSDRPRDTTSPLAQLLSCPSPSMTQYEYIRAVVSDVALYENALGVIVPSADDRSPSGYILKHIPWSWVIANKTLDGFEPSSFDVANPYTGGRTTFDAEDCIHYYSYDPLGGMSVASDEGSRIEALREVLYEQISAWNFRNSVWRNGGRVTQYLTRPANAPSWDPKDRVRFAKSWKERFAGENGTDTGGTPLLEDGMELKAVPFNARESQFVEATRLTREDVAAVYHINPSVIWHTESQTYASSKDNARALYSEALSPIFTMIQQRHNAVLVPKLGLDSSYYCEFDISSKLAASFEEQASVLQSSVGGPFMLRNEARARMNMPAIEGGDELIVPLNVVEGGLASPNDTDPTKGALPLRNDMTLPQTVGPDFAEQLAKAIMLAAQQLQPQPQVKALPATETRFQSKASGSATRDIVDVLRSFYKRQSLSFANLLAGMDPADMNVPFDQRKRWAVELADDLKKVCGMPMNEAAREALRVLGLDPDDFDLSDLVLTMNDMVETRADHIVKSTMERLQKELDDMRDSLTQDGVRDLVSGLYDKLMESRIERNASSLATGLANAGTVRGARKGDPKCKKEWVATGHNTRSSHAAMNGEQVGINEKFSNGARWPGDSSLGAAETCNCHCRIEIVSTR